MECKSQGVRGGLFGSKHIIWHFHFEVASSFKK